jgi:tetratricopeptide (TPR) repeat protein
LGIVFAVNGLWKQARRTFQDAAVLNPKSPLAPMHAAIAQQELGDLSGAAEEFDKLTREFPSFAPGWYRKAVSHLRQGELPEAEASFKKVQDLAPSEWRGPAGLGEVTLRKGRVEESVRFLEMALRLDPEAKPAAYLLGQAYRAAGEAAEAKFALSRGAGETFSPMVDEWSAHASEHMRSIPDLLQQAEALSRAGNFQAAAQRMTQALQYHPDHPGLLNELAIVFNRGGRAKEAMAVTGRLIARDPKNLAARITHAYAAAAIGHREESVQAATAAVELAPTSAQAHVALANAWLGLERDRPAVEAFTRAIQCEPSSSELHVEVANILWHNLGDTAGALEHLKIARQLNPADRTVLMHLGALLSELQETREADEVLSDLRKLAPNSPDLNKPKRQLRRQ